MLPGVIHEDLPRVPLYPVPIDQAATEDLLKPGAHLVYKVCQEPCRPCYRSALVVKVEGTKIHVIMNTSERDKTEHDKTEHDKTEHDKTERDKTEHDKTECDKTECDKTEHGKTERDKTEHGETGREKTEHGKTERDKTEQKGVKAECLEYCRTDHYIIKYSHCSEYSHCRYTDDQAVTRAEQRLEWGEEEYHCLYNNSHHFVTWAKTGRESSLADIIESLTYQTGNGVIQFYTSCIWYNQLNS